MAPGSGKTKTGRIWTYVRDERPFDGARPPAALFFYSSDRKGEHPRAHLERFSPLEEMPATAHAREVLPELAIVSAVPSGERPWLYATLGASEATRDEPTGLEFFLLSPSEERTHRDTLSSVAYFNSFYGLEAGRTFKVGRGWFPDATRS